MIDKRCVICGTVFLAKQVNYKTCSTNCSKIFNKQQQKLYYSNNKENIIARLNANAKRQLCNLICTVCSKEFKNRAGTQCCSDECREKLNAIKSTFRYKHRQYKNTCIECGKDFIKSIQSEHCSTMCYQRHKTKYVRDRYHNDVNFKLAAKLRSRLNKALCGHAKRGSSVKDLGCSISELKLYLESKWLPGMSWENHGQWHIDHVVPLFSFNLSDREQLLKACHYSNLQPLWTDDHNKKSAQDLKKYYHEEE
jgi:predicted nucleic acid-binding Zn ribbon protein